MNSFNWTILVLVSLVALYFLFSKVLPSVWAKITKKIGATRRRGKILAISVVIELAVMILPLIILCVFHLGTWEILIVAIWLFSIPATLAGIVYFWMAPNNLYFTFVDDGSAKFVVRGGGYEKTLFQYSGHALSPEGEVNPVENSQRGLFQRVFGSLYFYGLWPISDIWVYRFQWISQEATGQVIEHPKKLIDYVLVKPDVYVIRVREAETKDGLPVTAKVFLTIKVVNPQKAIFRVQNWLEAVTNRCIPIIADKLREKDYDIWRQCAKTLADEIMSDPDTQTLIHFFKTEWGVEVMAMEVAEIDPPEEYRKVTLEKFTGTKTAERMVAEISEAGIAMMANTRGVSIGAMKAEINANPEMAKTWDDFTRRMFKIKIAGGNLKMVESTGDPVLNMATLFSMFKGRDAKTEEGNI